MKNFLKLTSLFLILSFVLTAFIGCGDDTSNFEDKNLIYIIGDGMGFNHIENTSLYMDKDKLSFEEYYVGEVTTKSSDNDVTDSAASATALATGVKTKNGYVCMSPDREMLQNIMELSKAQGRKTGIVTTDSLSGATPASFSAHTVSRDNKMDIIDYQAEGDVDLLIGNFDISYMSGKQIFTDSGFDYAETLEGLSALSKEGKVLGNIPGVGSTYNPETPSAVTLKELVEYALEYLTADSDAKFTLMVEGAYIDKYSHNSDIMNMIYAMADLTDAVKYILDWASKRDDTAVIFTADHETGGLGKAQTKAELNNSLYTSNGTHTSANVPLYIFNVKTELNAFDNTDVYKIAKSVIARE